MKSERELARLGRFLRDRDQIIKDAHAAGITKWRIHVVTRLGRSTIDRIVGTSPVLCPCCGKPRSQHGTSTST